MTAGPLPRFIGTERFVKANPTVKEQPVEPVSLTLLDEIPESLPGIPNDGTEAFRAAWRSFYDEQASRFVDTLIAHAPGGLVDAILATLMERRASILRVRW